MRITGIDARLYRIPPAVQIQDSMQPISHWEFIVTTVATDAGVTGTGFAYTLGLGGTAVRELVGTYLTPLVLVCGLIQGSFLVQDNNDYYKFTGSFPDDDFYKEVVSRA